jgi:hypothetical protein
MGGLGPLIPDDGPRASRVWRRTRGILAELIALAALTGLAPLLVLIAVAVDATLWLRRRKPWMAVRLLAMAWWFLVGEMYGLLGLSLTWLAAGGRDSARLCRQAPLAAQSSRRHPTAVRADARDRGPRAGRPGPRDRHDPPREHHRQRPA